MTSCACEEEERMPSAGYLRRRRKNVLLMGDSVMRLFKLIKGVDVSRSLKEIARKGNLAEGVYEL